MTVVSATPDTTALTLTIVAELAATPERVWQIWSDPRQLERWWGPPTFPATFTEHEFVPGGTAKYHMTGPDGEEPHGWWRFLALDEPRSITFEEGFASSDGTPDDSLPTGRVEVTLEASDVGTRMAVVSFFDTVEQMQQMVEMGMVDGMREAMGQIDAILAAA